MTLIERLRRTERGPVGPGFGKSWPVNPDGPEAAAELEANAAEIGRKDAALEEARTVLMAHGFGAHSVTIAQIDAALNKQESGNV
jgi:hypothetical protein